MTTQQQFYLGNHCLRHIRTFPHGSQGRPSEKIQNKKTELNIVEGVDKRGVKRKYLQCPSCFMRFKLKTN